MGAKQTTIGHEKRSKDSEPALGDEVNFNHFQALRSIGRGSFGKVCIVQKKDSKKLYAMKYASKLKCIHDGAVGNMLQEQQLLRNLEHPFIVNLRYAFQDVEDVFMVEDLLLGGDLRYHLQQMGKLSDRDVLLYVAELALALDYLRSRRIIHRDVKPDNVLLDEEGRAHLTDFNVAAELEEGRIATSQCGTQPYIAPEIFECAVGERAGYSFPADWWSLGVTACELLKGKRPFEVPNSPTMAWDMFKMAEIHFSSNMSDDIKSVLSRLICVDPEARLCSTASLAACVPHLDLDAVLHKTLKHSFIPSTKQLNVDPTYELEELIIESKPIHKKKQRLAKVSTDPAHTGTEPQDEHVVQQLQQLEEKFLPYNWESTLKSASNAILPSVLLEEAAVHADGHVANMPAQPTPEQAPRAESRASLLQSDSRGGSPPERSNRRKTGDSGGAADKHGASSAASAPTLARDSGECLDNGVLPKSGPVEGRRRSAIVQELCTSTIICSAAMIADHERPPLPSLAMPALAAESALVSPADADEVGVADATVLASRCNPSEPHDSRRPSAATEPAATGCRPAPLDGRCFVVESGCRGISGLDAPSAATSLAKEEEGLPCQPRRDERSTAAAAATASAAAAFERSCPRSPCASLGGCCKVLGHDVSTGCSLPSVPVASGGSGIEGAAAACGSACDCPGCCCRLRRADDGMLAASDAREMRGPVCSPSAADASSPTSCGGVGHRSASGSVGASVEIAQ